MTPVEGRDNPGRPRRRLILCLDGTWNDASGATITNIVRLRDMIQPGVLEFDNAPPVEQRIYYDEGVGTGAGAVDRALGGALGLGLGTNVRQAYRFLSQFYAPGDEIFIFGFSRGAFTARSLAGYVGASGLLQPQHCTPELEERAWRNYRTDPKDRFPSEGVALARLCHAQVAIQVLGVFDTVGALGIPVKRLNGLGRHWFSFHDARLSSVVKVSLHALAIDEKRGPFSAALWERPFHANNKEVEQVWFPGVHSDVGGGYGEGGIGAIALRWMLDRIDALGRKHDFQLVLRPDLPPLSVDAAAPLHDSRAGPAWEIDRLRPQIRVIAQQRPAEIPAEVRLAALPPHARVIGEAVHVSALYRLRDRGTDDVGQVYRPANLLWALDALFPEDVPAAPVAPSVLVFVDERGEKIDWSARDGADACESLVAALPASYAARVRAARERWLRQEESAMRRLLGRQQPALHVVDPAGAPETSVGLTADPDRC